MAFAQDGPDRFSPGSVLTSDVGYGIACGKSETAGFARVTVASCRKNPGSPVKAGGVLSLSLPDPRPETMGTRWTWDVFSPDWVMAREPLAKVQPPSRESAGTPFPRVPAVTTLTENSFSIEQKRSGQTGARPPPALLTSSLPRRRRSRARLRNGQ